MKIIQVLVLAFLFVFVSCKKKGHVTGRVTNLYDGSPVAGITVGIGYSNGNAIRYKSGDLPEVTTDNNGEYVINSEYKNAKQYEYRISLRRPNGSIAVEDTISESVAAYFYSFGEYSEIPQIQDYRVLSKSKNESYDFSVVPAARLRVMIKDVPPLNPGVYIDVEVNDSKLASRSFYMTELGTDSTVAIYHYVVAKNNQVRIKWTISQYPDPPVGGETTVPVSAFKKATAYIEY